MAALSQPVDCLECLFRTQVKVVSFQSKDEEVSRLLKGLDGSAIIYVMTKKEAETLADVVRFKNVKPWPEI